MEDDDYEMMMSDDEEEITEKALTALRAGSTLTKNSDGKTLRCPYCPSKKKQSYEYKELLQHAVDLSKGKRGPESVGTHSALAEYLRTDLATMAAPPVERVHKLDVVFPEMEGENDLLVYPWSGVIFNIIVTLNADGIRVGASEQELKRVFMKYQPEKSTVCWSPEGHTGVGFITFRAGLEGWTHAQNFEKMFLDLRHGKKDWLRNQGNLGTELYGWLAKKEDYEGKHSRVMGRYFEKRGSLELKDVKMVGDELLTSKEVHIQQLRQAVDEKDSEFRKASEDLEIVKRQAEYTRSLLEEQHRKELEEVKKKAERAIQDHLLEMRSQHAILASSMGKLSERCKELERERDQMIADQDDKVELDQKIEKNKWRMELFNKQKQVQSQHHEDMKKLIQQQEQETGALEVAYQLKKLHLAEKHLNEFDDKRLEEIRYTQKFAHDLQDPTLFGPDALKELQEKISLIEGQKAKLEKENSQLNEEVVNLQENVDFHTDIVGVLTVNDRQKNDEILAAKAVAAEAIHSLVGASKQCAICVRQVGEIDKKPWVEACIERFKNSSEEWQIMCSTKFSLWEKAIRNAKFQPLKKILQDGKPPRMEVDRSNPRLVKLEQELGPKVLDTVVKAIEEIEEYNPSGRFPVQKIWNNTQGRVATLDEAVNFLWTLLKQGQNKRKKT